MKNFYKIAKLSYDAYARETDNKNFMGKEMPKFEELPDKIKCAWVSASQRVIDIIKQELKCEECCGKGITKTGVNEFLICKNCNGTGFDFNYSHKEFFNKIWEIGGGN
jgi:hypothetical protein